MRQFILILGLIATFSFTSCRNELDFESSIGTLSFSKETVYLDTVFTNIGSSTYTLKVYNNSNKNISIPRIRLGKGQASNYRLMVDGVPGKEFENVELLANDSMFVFIEVTSDVADANPTDFLYTDRIEFGGATDFQKVELVTLIQDAVFIYPERSGSPNNFTYEQINLGTNTDPVNITGTNLSHTDVVNGDELHWTNDKPYVVYGYAKIPENETLIVDAGAKVHFHANSGLIVADDASLDINGGLSTYNTDGSVLVNNEVTFEGDRLEPIYAEAAGQWGTVWFLPGSKANNITNLTIKNATVGMLVTGNDGTPTPTIDMTNVQIYNCANVGILARTGNMTGKNVVINNCGQASLACTFGGSYDFTHCTFANYWSAPSQTCLVMDNEDINSTTPTHLTNTNFKNCIFYGSSNLGISLEKFAGTFNYKFDNCLIRFNDFNNQFGSNPLYAFNNSALFTGCLISNNSNSFNPKFKNTDKNKLNILLGSSVIGNANLSFSNFADILGNSRATSSDIGAYEYLP
ncbi:hypothetical protein [Flavobacterium facile]|uniref:hypothetical protein n=1 Tax=Flavobacterium facile TaxID=2893174 RepID=UPI002E781131|nr:hypothetical protein [Flavobacterium sp. T-12]